MGNFATSQTATLTKNLLLFGLNTVFMIFLLFVFLKDGEKIYGFIYQVAPFDEKTKKLIFREINETFSAVIRGQLLTSLTQAAVAGIIFWILGLPLPILFAAMTFLAALIPVIGASGVWVPLVIYLFLGGQTVKAVVLLGFGVLVTALVRLGAVVGALQGLEFVAMLVAGGVIVSLWKTRGEPLVLDKA